MPNVQKRPSITDQVSARRRPLAEQEASKAGPAKCLSCRERPPMHRFDGCCSSECEGQILFERATDEWARGAYQKLPFVNRQCDQDYEGGDDE
jgi:hypothetical protein